MPRSHQQQAWILVDISTQLLTHYDYHQVVEKYPVSTASAGAGEKQDSLQTPRGWHTIANKIGENAPDNAVFKARTPTGEIYSEAIVDPDRDWILTRIMRLQGVEAGKNQGNNCDSYRRYIYIHGVPDEKLAKAPASKGCIGMSTESVKQLFQSVSEGTPLCVVEKSIHDIDAYADMAAEVAKQFEKPLINYNEVTL